MDMYQKRKIRQGKKMNNNEESFPKVSINWFPGHMAKTRKQIEEDMKLVDVVVELLDSRIPISSQNPDIKEIVRNKPKIIVLNKSDLADKTQNNLWVKYFKNNGQTAIVADCNSGTGINEVLREIERLMKSNIETLAEKGRVGRKIRVMIVGIPNVGKSSFINRVVKSSRLEVGNKPGVTKQKQWIRLNDKIELLDTPGVLWPKFESEKVALNLAYTGSIKNEILPQTEIAYQLLKFLLENYRSNISERYQISEEYIKNVLENQYQDENINIYEIMLEIGRKRGQIMSGGQVDDERTSKLILEEFRAGKIGKITIETPLSF